MRRIHVVKAVKRTFKDVQMMAQLPALLVGLYNLPVWCCTHSIEICLNILSRQPQQLFYALLRLRECAKVTA